MVPAHAPRQARPAGDPALASPSRSRPNLSRLKIRSEDEAGVELITEDSFAFALGPDRERFIAVQDLSPEPDRKIVVIENWAAAW